MTATTADFARTYVSKYRLAVVHIPPGKKYPEHEGWNKPGGWFNEAARAHMHYSKHPEQGIGVVLGPSRLCSLDVDCTEEARLVLAEFGVDIDHLAETCPTIVGNPERFRIEFSLPDGVELSRHALTWPNREGGKRHTVFELRAGDVQDVFPPTIHPDTQRPYEWRTRPNGHFPVLPPELLTIWQHWDIFKPQAEAVCPWGPKPAVHQPKAVKPRGDGGSVIEQFNQAHDLKTLLSRHGYEPRGKRWLSPHSGTKLPGVVFLDEQRCFIHHASDPLASDHPVNAFDVWCYYEHSNDTSRAVKAAAEALGIKMERKRPAAAPAAPRPLPAPGMVEPRFPSSMDRAPDERPLIFSSMPMKTADLFHARLPEGGRILHWRGEFYSWDGTRYVTRDRVYIDQRLYYFMAGCDTWKENPKTGDKEVVPFNPKTTTVNDVAHALRAVTYCDLPEPQCWIEQRPGDPPASEIIAFSNGFLHWPTRRMMPATDRLFVTSALDFAFDPNASEPREWLKFLSNLWPSDPESCTALADMFGYLLTDDTSQQKMFMLIGPPRCGKGTILRVLESMVGYHNRVSPSLVSIGTQFGLQPLIGKRLAMISDARLSGRADQQPIVENLLRISGEDAISIDRKHASAWTGKLPVRFVLASNELPAFSDASAALANRFMLFRFTESFLGREDHGLTARLLRELPGIVLWALDGLERLQERGYLLRPASSQQLAEDLVEQTSPMRSFINDTCELGDGFHCDRDELFKAWKTWCTEQGRDHPGTKVAFGRQLSAAFPTIRRAQPRNFGAGSGSAGTRLNLYSGARIIEPWERN